MLLDADDLPPAVELRLVARDLRQLVAAILALASAAASEGVPAPVPRRLEQIVNEASGIFGLISDALSWPRRPVRQARMVESRWPSSNG